MKMVGERPLNALMDGLADVRKTKVKEAYDKATVKCKAGSGGPPKPPPVAKEPPKKKPPVKAPAEATPNPSVSLPEDVLLQDEAQKKPAKKLPGRLLVRLFNAVNTRR